MSYDRGKLLQEKKHKVLHLYQVLLTIMNEKMNVFARSSYQVNSHCSIQLSQNELNWTEYVDQKRHILNKQKCCLIYGGKKRQFRENPEDHF